MNRFFISSFFAFFLLLSYSCSKDYQDLLEGSWEVVNVRDINDPYSYEWNFGDGELTMYRRLKNNPSSVNITDRGFYLLNTNPLKTTLTLISTSFEVYNDHWDVKKLDNEQLIIHMDIEGGILIREFVKIF